MSNIRMIVYGIGHLIQGVCLIMSLGFWNLPLASRVLFYFAQQDARKWKEQNRGKS